MSPNGDRTVISTWSTQLCKGLPFLPAQLLKDPEYWLTGDGTEDLALCGLVLCLQSQYVFIVPLDIIILFIWWRCNTLKTWNYNHGQNAWDTFTLVGRFSIHTYQLLLPHPLSPFTSRKQCWMNVSRIFPSFQYCIDWGAGESCRKILKRMHGFIRQPEITENYEHCVTVPGTLVQDCQVCTVPAPLSRVHPEEKRRLFTRQPQQMIRNCRMFSRNFLLIPFLGLKRWFNYKCYLL